MTEHSPLAEGNDAFYKTLLESTKAIPWKLDWKTKKFSYVGPQLEKLLGWPPADWIQIENWAASIHPEDRDRVVRFCSAQSEAGIDHEADYRALTKDGGFVWIRDVVHVIRDQNGEVEALVGFMFDISERKKNEEKLAALQTELEALSFTDGLTGIANRRMFDEYMRVEWASARRSQRLISLIMLDIDHFKQYNDHYGHVQGDDCLKRVANILTTAAARPRDLLARFGGEEFVLVLPETDAASALKVADKCRDLIASANIAHLNGGPKRILTISMGVGTRVPARDEAEPTAFIQEVDERLYIAKRKGRDCIVSESSEDADVSRSAV